MWQKTVLTGVSDLLFGPVSLLLLATAAWIVIQAGLLIRSGVQRARGVAPARARFTAAIDQARGSAPQDLDIVLESLVQRAEAEASRMLNSIRFAVRVGPSLGLMATLIPMSAALSGLANGDLPSLANNMVIAFSSTVVGIAVGVAAYMLSLVREAWVRSDLDAVRLHAERALRTVETPA
ncbi:MAG: MotA/TolQ/ExbB proton channel family protein [Phenylobacterium sp.]|uniref:MotA/TolQ/ExbB proton channel family protein n=1 Tax=Phenylobacterium sp. TaxID=1871053 RepID=UPI002725AE57|nr:MotA/TolQ/ExbB proton channel family protein [Phenylobacterium sp.]MDO8411432.1 MotA/TolQ/ExbB proton channel family protein [Phenylobacterium sp.]